MKLLLLLLFLCTVAHGRFSEHVILTPAVEDHAHQKFQPSLIAIPGNDEVVQVRIPWVEDSKDYWLVIAEKPLPDATLNFRSAIGAKLLPDGVLAVSSLARVGRWQGGSWVKSPPFIELTLRRTLLKRAYVYHDFANTRVRDGGYYYTIKLADYSVKERLPIHLSEPR